MKTLVAALALITLVGCGAPASTEPVAGPETSVVTTVAAPAPTGLEIPAIGVKTTAALVPLGLDDNMHLEVPPIEQPEVAGWFKSGVRPGDVGPAVIAAHVNGSGRPGLFARLHELTPGAKIFVDRADGSRVTFRVAKVVGFAKDAFPTHEVYGDTADAQLRLITCSGSFDDAANSYRDNLVVFAELTT